MFRTSFGASPTKTWWKKENICIRLQCYSCGIVEHICTERSGSWNKNGVAIAMSGPESSSDYDKLFVLVFYSLKRRITWW